MDTLPYSPRKKQQKPQKARAGIYIEIYVNPAPTKEYLEQEIRSIAPKYSWKATVEEKLPRSGILFPGTAYFIWVQPEKSTLRTEELEAMQIKLQDIAEILQITLGNVGELKTCKGVVVYS